MNQNCQHPHSENIEYIKVDDRDVTLVWNPPNDEGLKTYYFIDFKLSRQLLSDSRLHSF